MGSFSATTSEPKISAKPVGARDSGCVAAPSSLAGQETGGLGSRSPLIGLRKQVYSRLGVLLSTHGGPTRARVRTDSPPRIDQEERIMMDRETLRATLLHLLEEEMGEAYEAFDDSHGAARGPGAGLGRCGGPGDASGTPLPDSAGHGRVDGNQAARPAPGPGPEQTRGDDRREFDLDAQPTIDGRLTLTRSGFPLASGPSRTICRSVKRWDRESAAPGTEDPRHAREAAYPET